MGMATIHAAIATPISSEKITRKKQIDWVQKGWKFHHST
ncbi:hypothetical protein CAter282_2980 [Collimonas arenae]|uniref:Uncharacterized protein n=1 Tax=Collimonas arenae TaxID=279058 RepID=A0A127PSP8_9BURK|nr:hypothetical protein CAter10_3278 [Collimonas arenae]AMP10701.1 hypothetical protein CAter282_2980 [Collimonas arenae]